MLQTMGKRNSFLFALITSLGIFIIIQHMQLQSSLKETKILCGFKRKGLMIHHDNDGTVLTRKEATRIQQKIRRTIDLFTNKENKKNFYSNQISNNSSVPAFAVPNKVHYIWYAEKHITFTFQQYLSVLSVHKFQKPESIYFHTNKVPSGKYWRKTLKIPRFKVVYSARPKTIFGVEMKKAAFETSDSNISRVKILIEEGGIYLDTDVWVIKSLDPLRIHKCVLGAEFSDPLLLCGSVILANKNSSFLKLWMEHFLFDYQVDKWAYNSGAVPTKLAQQYPEIVHIEMKKLQHPIWNELQHLYGNKSYPWRDNYTLHLWRYVEKYGEFNSTITPHSIKSMTSTYGQAARHIYYKKH